MQWASDWICSIAACAVISAVALVIVPPGRVQRVTKFVCGVLMIIAIISPLTGGGEGISLDLAQYRADSEALAASAETENANLSRTIIQAELSEYILDKAASEGAALASAEVEVRWSPEGFWYPVGVRLTGSATQQQKNAVSQYIETQLGIGTENQEWSEDEGD